MNKVVGGTVMNNKGMTLIETLAAGVIISIVFMVLTNGIITAANWFAEGERIKNNNDVVANAVEGTNSSEVNVTVEDNQTLSLVDDKIGRAHV